MSKLVSNLSDFWSRFRKDTSAVIGLVIVLAVLFMAIFASVISPYDPYAMEFKALSAPSLSHIGGTDSLGRDVLSRIFFGSRLTLYTGFGAAGLAAALGVFIGAFAGYLGGIADSILMRITDFTLVIPSYFFYILIFALLKSYDPTIMFTVIALLLWPTMARVVRSEFLSLKEREFVKAARALGANDLRIILKELLPNSLASIIVVLTMNIAYAILWTSALHYIGLADPTAIDWAAIMNDGRSVMRSGWWLSAFPGLMIFLLVLAFNLVGDGLRDALDPRLRGI